MNYKKLIFYIIGTIIVGSIFSFLTMNNETFEALIKPPLNPPAIIFPIVWTTLYILMAISLYRVTNISDDKSLKIIYIVQLIVNTLWTFLFFGLNLRLLAFIWLILLIVLVIIMIIKFTKVDKVSLYLLLPYLLWILFEAYLNFGLYILNN